MPKTKKAEASSESDSGPEDRNPPPSKKTKEGNLVKKDDKGKEYYELDRNRRVYVDDFKGKQYLQIREYYLDKASGDMRPGKSGISLTQNEWKQLLALQADIKFN